MIDQSLVNVIESDLKILRMKVNHLEALLERAKQAEKPYDQSRVNWDLGSQVSNNREAKLLVDRKKLHLVQISPRRYSVIRLAAIMGVDFCEFDTVLPNIAYQQAANYIREKLK